MLGHEGHVTHGFGHGVTQGVPHFMQPLAELELAGAAAEVESAANAGTANDTATTTANTNTASFLITPPSFLLPLYIITHSPG